MCDFHARELLAERRKLADAIRPDREHFDNVSAYQRIRKIDALRQDHNEQTGFDCWEVARRAAAGAAEAA